MAYKMKNIKSLQNEKTLDVIFDEYITNCKLRGLSDFTIREYTQTYKCYIKSSITYPKEFTKTFIENLIVNLKDRGYKLTSVNSVIIRIKAFSSYMYKNGYIKEVKIKKLKDDENIKEPYNMQELKILLKKPNLQKSGFKQYRTWVLVCTVLSTGLRRLSLSNLKLDDIDFDSNLIYVDVTKNKRKQIIPMSLSLKKILTEYLKYRRNFCNEDMEYLFVDCYGKRLGLMEFTTNVQDYCISRGLNKSGLHRLRNTFAINYLNEGGNLFVLQELLNHKNLNVTRKYCYLTTTNLQQDFDKLNPLNNLLSNNKKVKLK